MKMLRIKSCTDSMMWYAKMVGQTVPYLGTWPEGYRSRDPAGYINVVRLDDAELIDIEADHLILECNVLGPGGCICMGFADPQPCRRCCLLRPPSPQQLSEGGWPHLLDLRMTKIETAMPNPITQAELDEFIRQQPATTGGYMAVIPAGRIRPEADADWQVGAKF